MTSTWQPAADTLARDLGGVFGARLRSVVVYGPHIDTASTDLLTCLALVSTLSVADLEACARLAPRWARDGIAVPLLLPEEEFRRSLDAFPLEYGEILRAHERVLGDDPFRDVVLAREDLRRACETQIKSHLVHLRQGFIESGGRPAAIASLVTASAPAFAALLRNVAALNGATARNRTDAAREGARGAGLADGVVTDILALTQPSAMPSADPARLFPEYLAAIEQLAGMVDAWHV